MTHQLLPGLQGTGLVANHPTPRPGPWSVFVAGEPAAYRERTTLIAGHVRSYKAKPTATWQQRIYDTAKDNPPPVMDTALVVRAEFRFGRTKRLPKRREIPHTVKPDLDNCLKSVLDGLSPWIPRDQVVVEAYISKRYALPGEAAGCEITIQPVSEPADNV
jgi:Holliday junction resolvase RusA-like endonuclease